MPTLNETFTPFFRMYVWQDDTKANLITKDQQSGQDHPITRIINMKRTSVLMQPDQIQITFALSDIRTGVFAVQETATATFKKGNYYEIYIGSDLPGNDLTYATVKGRADRLWASGYVQDLQKTASKGAEFQITGASAMIWLAEFRNLNDLVMNFTTDNPSKKDFKKSYLNVMYAINGLDGAGNEAGPNTVQKPGQFGMLSGSGWHAKYVDHDKGKTNFKNMPGYGDSWFTSLETVLTNLQTIAQHYNLFFRESPGSLGHKGVIEFGPLNDSSGVQIWGGKELDDAVGNWMDAKGYVRAPSNALDATRLGYSIIQAAQYEDRMDNIINLSWGIGSGTNPDSLVTIASYFHPLKDHQGNINAHSQINGPLSYSWVDQVNENLNPPANVITLAPDQGAHDYYWRWQPQPGGRVYFLMKTYTIGTRKYPGMVPGWDTDPSAGPIIFYQLVASEQQDGAFAYGVMEINSVVNYGIKEYVLLNKKINYPYALLSACIGASENSAETAPTWTFPVKHPYDPVSGLPIPGGNSSAQIATAHPVRVGQTLDVRFTGYVYEAIEQNPTDGQWYGQGQSYKYLHFPTTADIGNVVNGISIDKHMFDKITRVIQIDEEWNGHVYDVTYTMGQGKWKKQHWSDTIAKRFVDQETAPPRPYPPRHLKHVEFDNIPFILEFGASIDAQDKCIYLPSSGEMSSVDPGNPGAIAVTDIRDDHFFDNHHKIKFSVEVEKGDCVVDFWFHKPIYHHLADINTDPNGAYGILRLGFSNVQNNGVVKSGSSGKHSGFYVAKTSADGSVNVEQKVGLQLKHNTKYAALRANTTYHVILQWNDSVHKAWIIDANKKQPAQELFSYWRDVGGSNGGPLLVDLDPNTGKPVIDPATGKPSSQYGAIGWRCWGSDGVARAKISKIDVHPLRNDAGVTMAGEVQNNGDQKTYSTTVGSGSGLIESSSNGNPDPSDPNSYVTTRTQVTTGGTTYTWKQFLIGAHETKVKLTGALIADSPPYNIVFDNKLNPGFPFNGFPLWALPVGRDITLISTDGSGNTETIYVPPTDSTSSVGVSLIPSETFSHDDPWYIGFTLPPTTALSYSYPSATPAIMSWQIPVDGSVTKTQHYSASSKQTFTDIATGKKFHDHGWAHVIKTKEGRGELIIFPDGRIGWEGSAQTDQYGGLKSIQPEVISGAEFARGLDGHGVILFDGNEYDSSSQRVYLYNDTSLLSAISPQNNPNMYYSQDANGVQYGLPYSATDANSIQASWLASDQNDGSTGDSDFILQLTTGGGATNVLWQDCELLGDPDSNGVVKRKKFTVKHDVTFDFPIYIETAGWAGGVRTLGTECTISGNQPSGITSIPINEPVTDLALGVNDTWIIDPLPLAEQQGSDQETITVTGTDTTANALTISAPTRFPHQGGESILQHTYNGQIVSSGGKLTGTQNMDDVLPLVDAIGFGALVEFTATVTTGVNPGTQTVTFSQPITDKSINPNQPTIFMCDFQLPLLNTEEVITSYTLTNDAKGNVTGFTANFVNAHSSGFKVKWARWYRGWFGEANYIPPYKTDVGTINTGITGIDANGNPYNTYAVPVGATRSFKHLGTLGNGSGIEAGTWHNLHCKASQLGLFTKGSNHHPTIVGVEMSIHAPINVPPFTVFFDAHTVGHATKASQVGPVSGNNIKNAAMKWRHAHPNAWADAHFHADLAMWAQKDNIALSTPNDNRIRIKWEHDTTGGGANLATVVTHTGDAKHQYPISAGAPYDMVETSVSEDDPGLGIPAWPLTRNSSTGAISTATLSDGSTWSSADWNKVSLFWVIFNSNSLGFYVNDPGVQGHQVWIPGYNRCSSTVTVNSQTSVTVPAADIKGWSNYLSNANNSGGLFPATVLLTDGNKQTTTATINNVNTGTNQVSFSGSPSLSISTGWTMAGQTTGFALVTSHFNWQGKKSGSAVLNGPHEDFFKVGQISKNPLPHTGEHEVMTLHPHTKKGTKSTRAGTHSGKQQHKSHPGIQIHHNLVYALDSRNIHGNSSTQSTFHALKAHPNGANAQIETHTGVLLGALPIVNGKQMNVYINKVDPHDYIVYDTGEFTGYTKGFYAYTTNGTHKTWYNSGNWPQGAVIPVVAQYAGQGGSPAPLSYGKCYTNGRFDPHKDDSLGFTLVGRVSELADPHTRQYYLEGKHPHSQKTSGKTTGKKTIGKGATHSSHPMKKKRHKTHQQYTVVQYTQKKKKHGVVRHH